MEIKIMGLNQANLYIPSVPTYAIRIFSGCPDETDDYGLLKYSPNYVAVRDYTFDDIDDENFQEEDDEGLEEGFKLFDVETAEKIIREFEEKKKECLELMVHCRYGEGRSPAIAAALNDIFVLGEDSRRLFALYPKMNKLVYWRMIQKASESGYIEPWV